jgi:hypothetical protein
LKKATGLACLAIGFAGRLDCAPVERTSTAVVQRGNESVVDVQTLGEYPTTVDRICLSDLNQSTVVWEIATASGTPQIPKSVENRFFQSDATD